MCRCLSASPAHLWFTDYWVQVSDCFSCSPMISWKSSPSVLVEEINASNSFQGLKRWRFENTVVVSFSSEFQRRLFCLVNTNYATYLEVRENNNFTRCSTEYHFEQFGLYRLNLDDCAISVQVSQIGYFARIKIKGVHTAQTKRWGEGKKWMFKRGWIYVEA